ncbi:hypothetical protein NVP1189B_29 [Vibrio phage 1.189.B._10N.286.51.B5]|nr:hypothetical protein NVP1189B_29 [Vibrio phage 1.189.B._10N.286.51.B5]AUR93921.1 hypothetical protein NVP1189C_29 [Vibrio phage 1.189.C._10N.286.51.B5]AUR93987.1 hypothetical protein NVP1189O_29 [Vibrio phage 1.189.O._10N.286.51.B5]
MQKKLRNYFQKPEVRMRLIDYIKQHHDGNMAEFAQRHGYTRQAVSQMVKADNFHIKDNWIESHRRLRKLK